MLFTRFIDNMYFSCNIYQRERINPIKYAYLNWVTLLVYKNESRHQMVAQYFFFSSLQKKKASRFLSVVLTWNSSISSYSSASRKIKSTVYKMRVNEWKATAVLAGWHSFTRGNVSPHKDRIFLARNARLEYIKDVSKFINLICYFFFKECVQKIQ